MNILCWLFSHKPINPFAGFPAYCKRCLKDMSFDGKKWVVDDKAFEKEFMKDFPSVSLAKKKKEEE